MKDRIIAVLLVIGVTAGAYFGLQTTGHAAEQETLRAKIEEARGALDTTAIVSPDLKKELAAANLALETERQTLPLPPNSNDVIDALVLAGKRYGVTVVPLTTAPWETEEFDSRDFLVFELRARLSGQMDNILNLIDEIENGDFKGLVLADLTFEAGDGSPASDTANVIFRIYARTGA